MSSWPSLHDYLAAMQRPAESLRGTPLESFRPTTEPDGTLLPVQGQNAYVFYGRLGDVPTVVRCFKKPPAPQLRERYLLLRQYLDDVGCTYFAAFAWCDSGVRVGAQVVPVLRMEDVGGRSLRQHLAAVRGDREELEQLAASWEKLTAAMCVHRLAHGDLQQDNVWIGAGGDLRLVDFDGVWTPTVAHLPPAEVGHPNFQHPRRLSTGSWDEDTDRFSAQVVLISIRALIDDPDLWDEYHNDENLIFSEDDFTHSMQTPLWFRLAASRDPSVRLLVAQLHQWCTGVPPAPRPVPAPVRPAEPTVLPDVPVKPVKPVTVSTAGQVRPTRRGLLKRGGGRRPGRRGRGRVVVFLVVAALVVGLYLVGRNL